MFATLVQQYTLAINDGSIPNIESSWQYICREENSKAQAYAEEVFITQMRAMRSKMPMEQSPLSVEFKSAKEWGLQEFQKRAIGDDF